MSNIWRNTRIGYVGFISLVYAVSQAQANQQYQDPASLKNAVTQAVIENAQGHSYTNLEVSVRSIDGRLRLKQCSKPVSASVTNPAQQLGRITSEVRCDGDSPWKIYVQATATAEILVPVLVRTLPRGALISTQDVQFKSVPVGQQHQPVVETIDAIAGMEAKRQIAAGQPILLAQIVAPEVVKRGQQVNIRYGESELKITVAGRALENGASGDWISVENAGSGRRIEGRVNADGSVSVPGI